MNYLNLGDYGKAKVYLWKTEKTSEKLFCDVSRKIRNLYDKINYDDLFHQLYTHIKYINGNENELFIRYEKKIFEWSINKNLQDDQCFFTIFKNANYVRRHGSLSISYIDLIDENLKTDKINLFSNVFMSIGIHELSDLDIVKGSMDSNTKSKRGKKGEESDDKRDIYFKTVRENITNLINHYNYIHFSNSCVFIQRVLVIPSSDQYDDFIMTKIMEINNLFYKSKSEEVSKNRSNTCNDSGHIYVNRSYEMKPKEEKKKKKGT